MALNERSDASIRRSVSRLVAVRWPKDRVLLSMPCETERVAGRFETLLEMLGRSHCPGGACAADTHHLREPAYLCVTSQRLIYQARRPHGLPLRVASIAVAVVAFLAFVGGSGAMGIVGLSLLATAFWVAADAAQALGVRAGTLAFERVLRVDRTAQRLEAVGRWGTHYRLRIPDRDDFRFVAAMVERRAA